MMGQEKTKFGLSANVSVKILGAAALIAYIVAGFMLSTPAPWGLQ